jgi:hypothetical protein
MLLIYLFIYNLRFPFWMGIFFKVNFEKVYLLKNKVMDLKCKNPRWGVLFSYGFYPMASP